MDVAAQKTHQHRRLILAFGVFWMLGVCPPGLMAAAGRVDLEIESIQLNPERPTSATPITIVASIRNNGSEESAKFNIGLTIVSGKTKLRALKEVPVLGNLPRMGSGLSIPIMIGKLPAGTYEIVATVDASGYIDETNEDNNNKSKQFQVYEQSGNLRTY